MDEQALAEKAARGCEASLTALIGGYYDRIHRLAWRSVASFGQLLKGLPYLKAFTYEDVIALAQSARGPDLQGHRAEFVNLARLAKLAKPRP